jgi:hypothetical protein
VPPQPEQVGRAIHSTTTLSDHHGETLKPLTGGQLPPVQLLNPAGELCVLGPAPPLNARLPNRRGKANVIEYAKASPFEEKWHIEIIRRGTGGLGGFESKIGRSPGRLPALTLSPTAPGCSNFKTGNYATGHTASANGATVSRPNSRVG